MGSPPRWLVAADEAIAWLEDSFLIFASGAIALLVVAAVVLRYMFNSPLTWGEEFIVGLFTWAVFIGAAAAIRSQMHIRIEATGALFAKRRLRFVNTIAVIVGLGIIIALITAGVINAQDIAGVTTPMLDISRVAFDGAMPVGLALLLLHCVRMWLEWGSARVFQSSTETVGEEMPRL